MAPGARKLEATFRRLHFGLVGCRELVLDIDRLASYLADELELLGTAAG
jgi:hypothetical protein